MADVPAVTALLDVFRHVRPAQSVLRVVMEMQIPEQIPGFGFGEDEALFVGRPVNLLGGPDQCDPVSPIVVEQQLGFPAALQRGTEFIEEFSEEIFHG